MGACMSSGGYDEGDQKKRSQMIDRGLEEDSKKLRRECKILLLGKGDARLCFHAGGMHAACAERHTRDVESC